MERIFKSGELKLLVKAAFLRKVSSRGRFLRILLRNPSLYYHKLRDFLIGVLKEMSSEPLVYFFNTQVVAPNKCFKKEGLEPL